MQRYDRIGVFGGSFDPVHIGHLVVADTMRVKLNLAKVLFLPAGRPPHKPHQTLATDADRLAMLELALQDNTHFEVSRIDIDRSGPSYTADSVELLREQLPRSVEIVFLMGEDSLRDLPTWHDPGRIVSHTRLGVATRPGVTVDLRDIHERIPASFGRIDVVDVPLIGVSSSGIRDLVRHEGAFRYLVLPSVADYIAERNLYRAG